MGAMAAAVLVAACTAVSAADPRDSEVDAFLKRLNMVTEDGRRVAEVGLKDLLALAILRSLTLTGAKLGEEIAQSQLSVARSQFDPTVTTLGGFNRSVSASFSPSAATETTFVTSTARDAYTFSSSLGKKLASGMRYSLTYNEQRASAKSYIQKDVGSAPSPSFEIAPIEASALTGSLNVPLLQNAGAEYNEIPIRQAEVGVRLSREQSRQSEATLLRSIAQTYWNMVGLTEQIKVQQDAVRLSEQLLQENRLRLQSGVLSPADVKVSEAQLARDRQALLATQSDALATEDLIRAALNLENFDVGLRPIDVPRLRQEEVRYQELLDKAYKSDPALAILANQLENNRYALLSARNQDKTSLALDLSYVLNGYGKDPTSGVAGFPYTQFHGYGATLTWTLPLYDTQAKEAIRQALLQRAQLEAQLDAQKSSVSVQVQSAIRNLRLNRAAVETARVTVALQQEQLQNELERQRLGRSTSYRVAQVQQELATARQLEILARVNYEKTYLESLLLSSSVYEHYGLKSRAAP